MRPAFEPCGTRNKPARRPEHALPQRFPRRIGGTPITGRSDPLSAEVVARFAVAMRGWVCEGSGTASRCRDVASPGTGENQ